MSAESSAPSQPPTNESTMKIYIKNSEGVTTELDVTPSTTIGKLKADIDTPSQSSSNPDMRLVCNGTNLDNSESTLQDYNISTSSTLELTAPTLRPDTIQTLSEDAKASVPTQSSSAPKPPTTPSKPSASRKPRCTLKSCNAFAQRVVGDCGFCGGHFCGKHRLLESHNCSGLEDCKDEARERNRERLETERTIAVKGV